MDRMDGRCGGGGGGDVPQEPAHPSRQGARPYEAGPSFTLSEPSPRAKILASQKSRDQISVRACNCQTYRARRQTGWARTFESQSSWARSLQDRLKLEASTAKPEPWRVELVRLGSLIAKQLRPGLWRAKFTGPGPPELCWSVRNLLRSSSAQKLLRDKFVGSKRPKARTRSRTSAQARTSSFSDHRDSWNPNQFVPEISSQNSVGHRALHVLESDRQPLSTFQIRINVRLISVSTRWTFVGIRSSTTLQPRLLRPRRLFA